MPPKASPRNQTPKKPLSNEVMGHLETEFKDLLTPGGTYRQGPALPQESDDPDTLHLPRLILDFNRTTFARLKTLIDAINHA